MPMPIVYEQYRSIVVTQSDIYHWYESMVGPWYRYIGVYHWKCKQVERGAVLRCKSM